MFRIKTRNKSNILPKKNFRKIDDPNYSLFSEEYNRYKFMRKISIIFAIFGLLFFIPGLIFLIKGVIAAGVPLITFGSLGFMILIYLPILIMDHLKFKTVLELVAKKNNNELLELSKKYSLSNSYLDQEKARLATYALIDQKSKEIALILKNRLLQNKPIRIRELLSAFYLLAKKMGFVDHEDFAKYLENEQNIKPQKIIENAEREEIVIPITKVYFLEEIPENAKCMVSGLKLDFYKDNIVVCPYCSAWAKKELLTAWLNEKKTCPVCQRKLEIEDCPDVKI
ncbi:MAG: hypothetical protein ACFFDW_11785 [Candidatus Thorarchaeota archaeon]